jgi:hypothetical protein
MPSSSPVPGTLSKDAKVYGTKETQRQKRDIMKSKKTTCLQDRGRKDPTTCPVAGGPPKESTPVVDGVKDILAASSRSVFNSD